MLDKILKWAGVAFLGKLALDAAVNWFPSQFETEIGTPSVNYSAIFSANPSILVNVPVTVKNNTAVQVNVTGFDGNVFYGQVNAASVSLPYQAQLPGKGYAGFQLQFRISASRLIQDISAAMSSGGLYNLAINKIRVEGVLKTREFPPIPINMDVPLV